MRQSAAKRIITPRLQAGYVVYLREAERAPSTINKYKRSIARLAEWLNGRPATKEEVLTWKHRLAEQGMSPSSVNSAIAAANGFFRYAGWYDLQTRYLRVQRKAFRDSSRDLTLEEYRALVRQAYKVGDIPVALAMETIASTGIRVSELAYITVEVVRAGRADISLKGKIRVIMLPLRLKEKLQDYCNTRGIHSGQVIVDEDGLQYSRRRLWGRMKCISAGAGVDPSKAFPHNLRHLFAITFYQASGDIVKLVDVLGHSSVETRPPVSTLLRQVKNIAEHSMDWDWCSDRTRRNAYYLPTV